MAIDAEQLNAPVRSITSRCSMTSSCAAVADSMRGLISTKACGKVLKVWTAYIYSWPASLRSTLTRFDIQREHTYHAMLKVSIGAIAMRCCVDTLRFMANIP